MQQTRTRKAETILPIALAPREHGTTARRIRQDLRQSVHDKALVLAFQPRRRLHDHAELGAEAQIRWPCRGRGVLAASAFMPLVDECRLTLDVLAWTLDSACAAAASWPRGVVCVVAPAAAARDGSLLPLVGAALAQSGLDPERLEVAFNACEFGTGRGGEDEAMLLALSALRDHGVGVALEDFGGRSACLIQLKQLPLSTIKLDRSLVRDVLFDQAAAAMARILIDYAHALDIAVAAAVETAEQRALLRQLGCDAGVERAG
jgi:EAL domain-containing protein (putative c-di-GMP-specific phosphodiesterase class I)